MTVVIIGAGPAGLTVAERLRSNGVTDDVVLLSAEPFPPYAPPAMADFFLTGREQSIYWKGKDVCDRLQVDFRPGTTVKTIDATAREVAVAKGSPIRYDKLVLASGSSLYAPIPGADLRGVFNFKSLSAATDLVNHVRRGRVESAVIVGAGFIGVEVALLLADLGVSVTMVEMMDRVMPRMLDGDTARIVLGVLESRGVTVRLETRAEGFHGTRRARRVDLASGEAVEGDAYIAATGVKPNIAYLADSDVETKWGVIVDERMGTNIPDVFAAGDVAETVDRLTGERYVHAIFPNAVAQGQIVGDLLSGIDRRYEGAETMNSLKHLGVPVMAVGRSAGAEELTWSAGSCLRKVFLDEGRIVGFRLAGDTSAAGVLRSLMLKQVDVSDFGDRLVDPDFGIADVVFATHIAH